jgi:hypothetical protein
MNALQSSSDAKHSKRRAKNFQKKRAKFKIPAILTPETPRTALD